MRPVVGLVGRRQELPDGRFAAKTTVEFEAKSGGSKEEPADPALDVVKSCGPKPLVPSSAISENDASPDAVRVVTFKASKTKASESVKLAAVSCVDMVLFAEVTALALDVMEVRFSLLKLSAQTAFTSTI